MVVESNPGFRNRRECRSGRRVVSPFTMLREVEAFDFFTSRNAQADCFIDQEEQDQSSNDGDDPRKSYSAKLVEKLVPVSFDEAGWQDISRGVFEDWVNRT